MEPVSDRDEIGTASKAFFKDAKFAHGGSWGGGGGRGAHGTSQTEQK